MAKLSLQEKNNLRKEYFKTKEDLDIIRSEATLAKWKLLSAAYKKGKKIWGHSFSMEKLSIDMDMPYTTVRRCLALDKCNKNSWKKHEDGKISAFKLAMICQLKSLTYQDEIVDIVIEHNLSTYQIKDLKISEYEDIKKEKHRIAVQQGYSNKYAAALNFETWIERGKTFMLMDKNAVTLKKRQVIKEKLKQLKEDIETNWVS